MQPFYHSQVNKLMAALNGLEKVTVKYISRALDLQPSLLEWLDHTVQDYRDLGQLERESQLLLLKAEMVTAQRGINPNTLEKQSTHRNELQHNTAFRIMQAAEALLRSDLAPKMERIREAEDLVRQVVIAGFQEGIISREKIARTKKQSQLEALWNLLSRDPNISFGQTRILLLVSKYDVWILLGDLLAKVRGPVRSRNRGHKAFSEKEYAAANEEQ
jgi:hypothetical protein